MISTTRKDVQYDSFSLTLDYLWQRGKAKINGEYPDWHGIHQHLCFSLNKINSVVDTYFL